MLRLNLTLLVMLYSLSILGWGMMLQGLVPKLREDQGADQVFPLLWFVFGLLGVTVVAILVNFAVPLTTQSGLVVIAVGMVGIVLNRRRLPRLAEMLLALSLAALWVAFAMPFKGFFSDAGLYHLQFEQWMAHSPVLSGLAQIQSRLGFDSTWLILVSALRIQLPPEFMPEWGHAVAADMMIRAFIYGWLLLAFKQTLGQAAARPQRIFYGAAFVVLSLFLWRMREAGTDNPANLLCVGIWLLFFKHCQGEGRPLELAAAGLGLAALIATSKLSVVPMTLLIIPLLLGCRRDWLALGRVFSLCLALVVLWVLRNLVLTGCWVYPVAPTCMDLPWALSAATAIGEAHSVTTFAREHIGPGLVLGLPPALTETFTWAWLGEWARQFPQTYYFRMTAVATALGALAFWFFRRRALPPGGARFVGVSLLASGLTFLYWLLLGPDPRFSWSFFVVASVTLLYFGFGRSDVQVAPAATTGGAGYPKYFAPAFLVLCLVVGGFNRSSIDFEKHVRYELEVVNHREVPFYLAQEGMCGDKYPCVFAISEATNRFLDNLSERERGWLARVAQGAK